MCVCVERWREGGRGGEQWWETMNVARTFSEPRLALASDVLGVSRDESGSVIWVELFGWVLRPLEDVR